MSRKRIHGLAEIVFWAGLWLLLFRALWVDWEVNPQYGYGWLVPLLAAGLFWKRWETRPQPRPPHHGAALPWLTGLLLLGLFPVLLIAEANPEWRRMMWLHGLITVGVTLLLLGVRGGGAWVQHFAFPVCFCLVAIPWPYAPELAVIQGLARWVAQVVSEVLPWLGVPALVRGNLIEVGTGVVGVEEACSGIRSFQSTLMLALFFGEHYRLGWGRRVSLVGLGSVIALAGNLGRTLFLTLQAARAGDAGIEHWHDPIGYTMSGLGFGLVWGLAFLLRQRGPLAPDGDRVAGGSRAEATTISGATAAPLRPVFVWLALGWVALSLLGVEAWYRLHEQHLVTRPAWHFAWPEVSEPVEISERESWILRCDFQDARRWTDPAGRSWMVYHLGWSPRRGSAQLAKGHTPAGCFPATGLRLVEDLGSQRVTAQGVDFAFHQYLFEAEGRPLHAFWCLYEEKAAPVAPALREDWTATSRMTAVRHGRRNSGQQVIEAVLVGEENPDEARRNLVGMLSRRLQIEGGP